MPGGRRGIDLTQKAGIVQLLVLDNWPDAPIAGGRGGLRRRCRVDPGHRAEKAVAAPGNSLDSASLSSTLIEHPAKRRDLRAQIVVLDHRCRPDGGDDCVAGDEISRPLDQHTENAKRARADRHRYKGTTLVAPEQTAAARVEAEAFEQKNVPPAERVHMSDSHAPQNSRKF